MSATKDYSSKAKQLDLLYDAKWGLKELLSDPRLGGVDPVLNVGDKKIPKLNLAVVLVQQ